MVENWFLLVDGANMLISSAHALREDRTAVDPDEEEGRQTGGVFGMFYRMREIIWDYHEYTAIVVWDGGASHRRRRLYQDYKAQRKEKERWLLDQFPWARALCSNMGIVNVRVRGVEADDIISFLARQSDRALIYSSDRDFLQLVGDHIGIIRAPKDPPVTTKNLLENIERAYKVPYTSTDMVRMAYALAGDPGDNIQGIAGVGHKKAFDILTQYERECHGLPPVQSDHEALRLMCATDRRKVWRRVAENWDDFLLARELTDLHRNDLLLPQEIAAVLSQLRSRSQLFQLDRFITLARDLELPNVLDRLGFLTYAMTRRCKEIDTRALL